VLGRVIDLHGSTKDGDCRTCARWIWEWLDDACEVEYRHAEPMPAPCPTLRGIAVQYAHRPGYLSQWRP